MYVTVSKPRCGCQLVPLRLAGLVLDLTHLVHVDKRVEVGCVHAGERADHGESLALVAARAGGHRADRALGVGSDGPAMRGRVKVSAVTAGMRCSFEAGKFLLPE